MSFLSLLSLQTSPFYCPSFPFSLPLSLCHSPLLLPFDPLEIQNIQHGLLYIPSLIIHGSTEFLIYCASFAGYIKFREMRIYSEIGLRAVGCLGMCECIHVSMSFYKTRNLVNVFLNFLIFLQTFHKVLLWDRKVWQRQLWRWGYIYADWNIAKNNSNNKFHWKIDFTTSSIGYYQLFSYHCHSPNSLDFLSPKPERRSRTLEISHQKPAKCVCTMLLNHLCDNNLPY